ncbi:flippase [Halomonas sp. GXIMD04776]|uniref:flippase n=1 Tax=Halomonas sp. GXIMD04776 TaxID=3415605 RepID=UPI003CAE5E82
MFGNKNSKLNILKTSGSSVLLKVFNVLVVLLISIVLARSLGPDGYGIYAFAYSIATLLAVPVQLGIPQLIVREIAGFQLDNKWELFKGILQRANQSVVIVTTIIFTVLILWLFLYGNSNVDSLSIQVFSWAALLIPFIALGNIRGAVLRGIRSVILGQLPEMVIRPGLFLLLVLIAGYYGALQSTSAMMLNVIASFTTFVIGSIMLQKKIPIEVKSVDASYETKRWIGSALPFALIAGMQVINRQTDILMLGFLGGSEEVGLYKVAAQGSLLVAFALTSINMVLAPYVTRLYKQGNSVQLQKMITLSAQIILATALPVAAVFIVFGEFFLLQVFGNEFVDAYPPLAILCVGQLINAGLGSVVLLLNMTGNEKDTVRGVVVAAILNVVFNLILIPFLGMVGAAIATMITTAVWNVLLCIKLWKKTGIYSLAFRFKL